MEIEKGEINKKEIFAEGMCFKKIFWIFIVGCVFGVVFEMVVTYIQNGVWVSRRGLIYGPLNPVYGIGAALMAMFLYKGKNIFWIFLGGALIGGGFEYICSVIQEFFFNRVSWDYTGDFLSIGGRTSFFYMVCWGVLAIIFIKLILPFISNIIEKFPIKAGNIITTCLIIFVIFDVLISLVACLRQAERGYGKEPSNGIEAYIDKTYPDHRLDEVFENAKEVK